MLRRETGKPFPEADRGLPAPRGVCSVRAKGVRGVESTAELSALRGEAARRRAQADRANARLGASSSAFRLSPDRGVAAPRSVVCQRHAGVSAVASGGAESAAKEAKTPAFGRQ